MSLEEIGGAPALPPDPTLAPALRLSDGMVPKDLGRRAAPAVQTMASAPPPRIAPASWAGLRARLGGGLARAQASEAPYWPMRPRPAAPPAPPVDLADDGADERAMDPPPEVTPDLLAEAEVAAFGLLAGPAATYDLATSEDATPDPIWEAVYGLEGAARVGEGAEDRVVSRAAATAAIDFDALEDEPRRTTPPLWAGTRGAGHEPEDDLEPMEILIEAEPADAAEPAIEEAFAPAADPTAMRVTRRAFDDVDRERARSDAAPLAAGAIQFGLTAEDLDRMFDEDFRPHG